ncbi:MAG TPA: TetR/AcrR family transcriptional regulator [Candidatus Binatia bacterium]|jgi:AcrR family transcriptional regulator|nr:TetR/AcrR family transcriptional regulator [Candidatus Binatia bacterium]
MPSTSTPVNKPRWRRRPDRRPDEILDAALRVFARCGLHKTNLEEVAKEAGISKGTIYLYFKDKEELFVAAAHRIVPNPDEIYRKQHVAPTTNTSFHHLLRQVARTAYRRFCTPAYLAFFSMMTAEALRHPEWGEIYFRRIGLELNRRIAEIFEHAIQTGKCRKVDPLLAARSFVGMFLMMALTQEHLGGRKYTPLSERKVIDSLTDIFLHGIVPNGK